MLRSNLRILGISEVKTNNGGVITATNARTKESVKAQATFTGSSVTATINGKDVAFFFEPSDELYAVARNNKLVVSAEAMRQLNPKLEDIVVRKNN